MAIHSNGQTIFSFTHIKDITLGADEKVDEVAGGASGMGGLLEEEKWPFILGGKLFLNNFYF